MATKATTGAGTSGTEGAALSAEPAAKEPPRPRKTAAARVATKTARAAKRQAKKSGKALAAPASSPPKGSASVSGARTASAAKRKASAKAKGGVLSRSVGRVRSVFSKAATSLSSLVRGKPKG